MSIEVKPSALKQTKPRDYAIRFVFGGVVTVAAGLIAHFFGAVVGGLFLAFPAILPASLTLVKEHRGRELAADDASGAAFGSLGLVGFAAVVWGASGAVHPVTVLACATIMWFVTSVAWWAGARGPS